jgi:hypothetical protein
MKDGNPNRGCVGLRVNRRMVITPLGLRDILLLGSQGSREARQPWAVRRNRFAVVAMPNSKT